MTSAHYSIYIPRIFNNIPNKKISDIFEELGLGEVSTMDIIYKTGSDGSRYKMAFIHFTNWYNTSTALNFRNKIENPDIEAKLVYDDPWYWIVLPNSSKPTTFTKYKNVISTFIVLRECPCCQYRNEHKFDYHDTGNISPMSVSELVIDSDIETGTTTRDKSLSTSTPKTTGGFYDTIRKSKIVANSNSVNNFYDLEVGNTSESHIILIPDKPIITKQWITEHICGNL